MARDNEGSMLLRAHLYTSSPLFRCHTTSAFISSSGAAIATTHITRVLPSLPNPKLAPPHALYQHLAPSTQPQTATPKPLARILPPSTLIAKQLSTAHHSTTLFHAEHPECIGLPYPRNSVIDALPPPSQIKVLARNSPQQEVVLRTWHLAPLPLAAPPPAPTFQIYRTTKPTLTNSPATPTIHSPACFSCIWHIKIATSSTLLPSLATCCPC
ncbi:hypothetical protein PCANC_09155 [Puccinia coronata f. sp. avenae]|uniref:Uncharacterized protein n=1 Tax=Puccinia coronata f. sp. avenae TaxID=200324 RepID=A0A2N5VV40_9BASI|nr:hypothetical protein PCANC_09155 [Puccinia coronata f. sp. avenae]